MDKERSVIRISVRNLVEFILRSGDIDNRTAGADKDAMAMGSRLHRKIQKRMGADYRAEVLLKHDAVCEDFILRIEGRADGIMETPAGTVIDEIKCVFRDLEQITEPAGVHLAQAKCYAYIHACDCGLEQIGVQTTYCNLETEEIKRFQYAYVIKELEEWFDKLVRQYEKWARFQKRWKEKRDDSIKPLEFPFAYREGQKELAASVYYTIRRKKKLFIQAPTGVGKTISTVFPAVKALGEELGDRIFYLTAKTITRTVAWQAFDVLRERALRMKVVVLTAKEKVCFCEETECNPEACPYAKGHFDRVNDAVYELLTSKDMFSREVLEEQARKWKVCPFEMGLDVSTWADAVICDYNYVFDPNAHLKRFFGEGNKGEYLFLVDEAHNLVERAREMYSADLCKEDILKIKRKVKTGDPKLAGRLEECNRQLLGLKRECERYQILDGAANVYLKLVTLLGELERYLEDCRNEEIRKEVLDLYFAIRTFADVYERLDENYMIYSELQENGEFHLHLFCVNPAARLQEYLDRGSSTVFFSATLLPVHYYKNLLSTARDDYAVYAKSPFDPRNRLLLLGGDVSTRYTLRGTSMYRRYAGYLLEITRSRRGNYMAFFPSYRFMGAVYEEFCSLLETEEDDVEHVMQLPYMSEESREIFLENFEEDRDRSLMGFCVLGGIFSEGIDLADDKLIGAVIVGTGLPQVCTERELLKKFFDEKGMRGFDYAYLYPGMNKVLQAAGRVIRTAEDKGVILLLDERFRDYRYRSIFPREWSAYGWCNLGNVSQRLEQFWSGRDV